MRTFALHAGAADTIPAHSPRVARRFAADVHRLGRALRLPVSSKRLAAWHIWAPTTRPSQRALRGFGLDATTARFVQREWARGHSQCYPPAQLVVLASTRRAHVAEEAAHLLRHITVALDVPDHPVDAFYMRAVEEALAFFASKLLCPRRRAPSPAVAKNWAGGSPAEQCAAAAAFAHVAMERGAPANLTALFPGRPEAVHAATHLLGYRLGEALYRAYSQGRCDPCKLARLFARPTNGRQQAFVLYFQLALCLRDYLGRLAETAPQ